MTVIADVELVRKLRKIDAYGAPTDAELQALGITLTDGIHVFNTKDGFDYIRTAGVFSPSSPRAKKTVFGTIGANNQTSGSSLYTGVGASYTPTTTGNLLVSGSGAYFVNSAGTAVIISLMYSPSNAAFTIGQAPPMDAISVDVFNWTLSALGAATSYNYFWYERITGLTLGSPVRIGFFHASDGTHQLSANYEGWSIEEY